MNHTRLSLSITRNKRTYNLGVIKGGHWWEHLITHTRLFYWNLVTRARRKHNG